MSDKVFIMLAAPSMIGKTTVAKEVCTNKPLIKLIHNDELLGNLCALTRFPLPDISKEEVWKPLIDAKVDFNGLTRLLHNNIILENPAHSMFLAEGYLYMFGWYREQVRVAFENLDCQISCHLLRYEPSIDHQVFCQKTSFAKINWNETSEEHQRQLKVKWKKFEDPQMDSFLFDSFDVVNETNYLDTIDQIARQHSQVVQ